MFGVCAARGHCLCSKPTNLQTVDLLLSVDTVMPLLVQRADRRPRVALMSSGGIANWSLHIASVLLDIWSSGLFCN